jgi:hypothetical protein
MWQITSWGEEVIISQNRKPENDSGGWVCSYNNSLLPGLRVPSREALILSEGNSRSDLNTFQSSPHPTPRRSTSLPNIITLEPD